MESVRGRLGALHGQGLTEADFKAIAAPLGRTTRQRTTGYGHADGKLDVAEVSRQFEQDVPIWENKIYRERPHVVESEQGIPPFRRWYRQFYVE